jgi:phytanoyl-CoA hydroxylase
LLTRSCPDYRTLNEKGILKVHGLIPPKDIQELSEHMDNILLGKDTAPGFPKIDASMTDADRLAAFSRIHNAHRVHPLHERFLLHPRILDVIEQLTGPDVLALQSMTFFKQPGQPGQG